ncbi:MAG: hypothetical protein HWD84_10520 [Flavobacteriaceae bacterium]|nr:hypothetical protein [Flavobacteriaceae bacterium]
MKLNPIKTDHIFKSAQKIDREGVPKDLVWSQYYVVVNGKEYRFKQLLREAYTIATGDKLKFETSDSYKNYIKDVLGFEMTFHEGGFNFFTKDELEYYHSIVGAEYRKDNPNHKLYIQKLNPIISKVEYWAKQLVEDGYKFKADRKWLSGHESKIARYFWPRIYKGVDQDIFFNVEVNGADRWIGYKLDGYNSTKKKLPEDKLAILVEFQKKPEWSWPKISFDDIGSYDWDSLLSESKSYVEALDDSYDALKKVLNKHSKLARITWNTNNWIKPSGRYGKSKNDSHESEKGFGHEEWIFDGDTVLNGFKYGFLEPIHRSRDKHSGEVYDITLFTRDWDTKTDYWVTTLKDVEVLDKTQSEQVLAEYKSRGWYDQMKRDLIKQGLSGDALEDWVKDDPWKLFNIRFPVAELSRLSEDLLEIENKNDIPSMRYVLMDFQKNFTEKIEGKLKSGFSFENSGSYNADLANKGKRKSGFKRDVELSFKHNEIQKKLLNYLQGKYGLKNVKRECTAYGASRIDIVRKTSKGYVFYEIKTYNSLISSIRESLGQLLEYSLFPNKEEANELVLVSHIKPSDLETQYFLHLKKFINIPFSYICFDPDQEKVVSEIS